MYPTVIYRVSSPETTPTCVYVDHNESSVSIQPPYKILVTTNNRNDIARADTKTIYTELKQIKNDIRELKKQQTSPTFYKIKQEYQNDVSSMSTPFSSNNQPNLYSQNAIHYCNECDSILEERAYAQNPIFRPKTAATTYRDSYKRVSSSPQPIGYLCYPVYSERAVTLKELQKQFPSLSPAVQNRPQWIPPSVKNAYSQRR
ncbi:unnamed protein product [Rotaria sp. Silwood1]|nr:unnamed protein product [Rotaria sp. Silwood1]